MREIVSVCQQPSQKMLIVPESLLINRKEAVGKDSFPFPHLHNSLCLSVLPQIIVIKNEIKEHVTTSGCASQVKLVVLGESKPIKLT